MRAGARTAAALRLRCPGWHAAQVQRHVDGTTPNPKQTTPNRSSGGTLTHTQTGTQTGTHKDTHRHTHTRAGTHTDTCPPTDSDHTGRSPCYAPRRSSVAGMGKWEMEWEMGRARVVSYWPGALVHWRFGGIDEDGRTC